MLNPRSILRILGLILLTEAIFMWISIPVSFIYKEKDALQFLLSGAVTGVVGGLAYLSARKTKLEINQRDGYLIVTGGWLLFSLFGTLPFLFTHSIPSFTDAFFETISGFTTTGASILNNIEELSHAVLFWRSLTQWLGGMGIILLTLIILPYLGIGGMQLFTAEVPGPTPDKLHPHIRDTAQRLWLIYLSFTVAEILLLWAGDMGLFDAVCHSLTTMATGGYSTKQASIAYWDSPYIHYVITLFMFLAGTNFTLSYFAMHGHLRKVWVNEEFRWYFGRDNWLVLAMTPPVALADALDEPRLAEFTGPNDGIAHRDEIHAIVARRLRERTTDEWVAVFDERRLWSGPVAHYDDLIDHPQVRATDMIVEIDDGKGTPIRLPAPPLRLSATPTGIRRAPPRLGADTDEVMGEWLGWSDERLARAHADGVFGGPQAEEGT